MNKVLTNLNRASSDGEWISKEIASLSSETDCPREWKRVKIINELRRKYKLADLLALAGIARSTYYYTLKQMNQPEKHTSLKEIIREIFLENKRRYGYRRITMELHQRGISANHKLVQKIMRQCNFFASAGKANTSPTGALWDTQPPISSTEISKLRSPCRSSPQMCPSLR